MNPAIFKAYDIRGLYGQQFNEDDARKIGCAAAQYLTSQVQGLEGGQSMHAVCVGRDMRTHSPSLAEAIMEGIRAAGLGAIDIGMVDTPQIYFAINHLGTCGGIQVTASHNPAQYNGFKISGIGAIPVGLDSGLQEIRDLALSGPHTMGNPTGSVRQVDLTEAYKKHVLQFLGAGLGGLRIAVDASNGMAGKMVPLLFGGLPLEIVSINFEHDGTFKHDPNPLIEENLKELQSVIRSKRCHFGLCFDGDADRLMMVDEQGRTVGCDLMTALMVPYFLKHRPKSAVVYDLRSSRVVPEEILKYGGTPRRERVGHAYMKKALRDSHAVFGGELSGHFYYSDNFNADSGVITLVHILNIVSESGCPVSDLIEPLSRYARSGELNFEVEDKKTRMEELARQYGEGQVDHLDGVTIGFKDWWFNCRSSNTEPLLRLNVEAKTQAMLEEKLAEIQMILGKPVRGH